MNSGESFDEDKSDISDSSSTDQKESDNSKDQNKGSNEKSYKESKVSFDASINNIDPLKKIRIKEIFELYQRELDKKDKKIILFEKEIASKNRRIIELQGKVVALEEKVSSDNTLSHKAVRRFSRQEPDLLSAREEVIQTLCDKYGKAMADLQNVSADYKALQEAILRSGQEQESNIITAQESITAAVSAKVRCAELEEENADLISQLIDLKTKFAVAIENETAKNNELLSQIDGYVDKIALMEKKYVQALAYALPQGRSNSDGETTAETETAVSSQNGGSNYSTDGAYMNVDDIYSIEESSKEVVSPIFTRNLNRAGLTLETGAGAVTPTPAASNSASSSHPPKSPFASHIAETSGPHVNPLSSKNWLWK